MHLSAGATAGLLVAALAAGMLDAVAGGSGLIAVPALLAAGLPPHLALGTNKAQGVFGTCASTLRYARAGLLDGKRARVTFPAGFAGSLCGAALVLLVPPATLRPVVMALLVGAALALALRPAVRGGTAAASKGSSLSTPDASSNPSARRSTSGSFAMAAAVALLLGAYDGFFGPGVGTFIIAAFAGLLHRPLARATADAKVLNFASNFAALVMFASRGAVLWAVALPMAATQILGGFFGAHLAVRRGEGLIRAVVLVVVAALVLWLLKDMSGARWMP